MEVINEAATFVARALELIRVFLEVHEVVEGGHLHHAVEHLDAALDTLTSKEKI